MLTARLERPIQGQELAIGPTDHLQMLGKFLLLADGTEVAIHQGGLFMKQGIAYIGLQIDTPVTVEFGHTEFPQTEAFGPYPGLRIVNGTMWGGKPPQELMARFDETLSAWHLSTRPAISMNKLTIRPA